MFTSESDLFLKEVWRALGCAPNPDDFKPEVRARMRAQAISMIRGQALRSGRTYQENVRLREEVIALATDKQERGSPLSLADLWHDGERAGMDSMMPGNSAPRERNPYQPDKH